MLTQLLNWDTELFVFFNQLGSERWDWLWLTITNKWASVPLYILLLYQVFKRYGLRGTAVVLISTAGMIALSDQVTYFMKHSIGRPRPCQVESLKPYIRYIATDCGRYGYISAHAASSTALAVFLSCCLRKKLRFLPVVLISWALLVSYSRIYIGVHYPLDVISGIGFGVFTGWIFFKLQKWAQLKYNPHLRPLIQ